MNMFNNLKGVPILSDEIRKEIFMANICLSGLRVTGPIEELKKFKEFAKEVPPFACRDARILSEQKFIPLPGPLEDEELCVEYWGTCPGFIDPIIEKETSRYIFYRFHTKWSPIIPVIQKMGEMFPKLSFFYGYWEPEGCFGGQFHIRKGEKTKELWEKCLCSEEILERSEGRDIKFEIIEFSEQMTPEVLITALKIGGIKMPVATSPVGSLNKLLGREKLYKVMKIHPQESLNNILELSIGGKLRPVQLRELNRQLIESNYPSETPKRKDKRTNKSS
jgi:hypothetical protein